jgi:site-specific DNA recombinase
MTTAKATLTAREYLRVSVDKSGRERSPEEQHKEHTATAAELGIALGKPYKDLGSASRYAKKARDDFQRLMADLRSGTFAADLLWLWESSRGSRKTGEWVTLLDLLEEKGVRVYVQMHERIFDPANGSDRRALLLDAVDSEYESYKTHKRVTRAVKTNLNHEGGARGHGVCPFGYSRSYERERDDMGRRVLRPTEQAPEPKEAEAVIELFYRIKAGHSIAAVARDFAARGLVGRQGKPMSGQTLRGMARRVAYIGKRTHKGAELDASWPVVADFPGASYDGRPVSVADFVKTFHDVQALLDDPDRRTNNASGAKHALSGALKCQPCGAPMTVTYRKAAGTEQPPAYQCHGRGCTRINKEDTDRTVLRPLLAYLAQPENYHAITPQDGGAELASVQGELASKKAARKMWQAQEPETPEALGVLDRKVKQLTEDITRLEKREAELTPGPSPLAKLFDYGPDVEKRWNAQPVEVQRQIARLVLAPDALGEVHVKRLADSASAHVHDRLEWVTA